MINKTKLKKSFMFNIFDFVFHFLFAFCVFFLEIQISVASDPVPKNICLKGSQQFSFFIYSCMFFHSSFSQKKQRKTWRPIYFMIQTRVYWTITITFPLDVYFYIIFLFLLLNFSPSSSTCYSLCYAIVIVHFGHTSSCFSLKIPKHHFRHSVAFCVCTISISYLHTMLSRVSGWLSVCPWVCFVSWCDDMASMSSTLCSSFWFGCNISRKSHLPPLTVRPLLYIHHFGAMTEHWEWSS